MSVIAINLAQPYPLPFDSFAVVSAELASLSPADNIGRTYRMRDLLRQNNVAFVEAAGVYQGAREACFVLLGGNAYSQAKLLGQLFGQDSVLIVADRYGCYHYADGRTERLPAWRIVDPATDPCLAVPGCEPIQFF